MKRLLLFLILCLCASILLSCTSPDGNTGSGGEGSGGEEKKFLVEDEDYIDITSTYDGESFDYDSSLWYMNELSKVPLPDPHVYVEDDTYYIVGTSDRNPDPHNSDG